MEGMLLRIFASLFKTGVATATGIVTVVPITLLLLGLTYSLTFLIRTFFPEDSGGFAGVPTTAGVIFILGGFLTFLTSPWLGGFFSGYTLNILGKTNVFLSIISAFIVGAIAGNVFKIGLPYLFRPGNPTIPGPPPLEVQLQLNKILSTSIANGIPAAFLGFLGYACGKLW